jgi:hypothetical protein
MTVDSVSSVSAMLFKFTCSIVWMKMEGGKRTSNFRQGSQSKAIPIHCNPQASIWIIQHYYPSLSCLHGGAYRLERKVILFED